MSAFSRRNAQSLVKLIVAATCLLMIRHCSDTYLVNWSISMHLQSDNLEHYVRIRGCMSELVTLALSAW